MYHLPEVTWLTFLYTCNGEEILTHSTTKPAREGWCLRWGENCGCFSLTVVESMTLPGL